MRGAHGAELLGQRKPLIADVVDGELMAVDRVVELGDHRVQQAGDSGDQDERADENTGVEMQSKQ